MVKPFLTLSLSLILLTGCSSKKPIPSVILPPPPVASDPGFCTQAKTGVYVYVGPDNKVGASELSCLDAQRVYHDSPTDSYFDGSTLYGGTPTGELDITPLPEYLQPLSKA